MLRELVLRPDTPLKYDVERVIAGQLDKGEIRIAAIRGNPRSSPARDGQRK